MTHTPGPWKARTHDRLDDLIIGADGEIVAHLYEERDREEVEANFALIAAAPAMLDALEEIANFPHLDCQEGYCPRDVAREAIKGALL